MENIQNYKDALASVSKKEMEQRKTIKRLLQEKEELKKQLALYGVSGNTLLPDKLKVYVCTDCQEINVKKDNRKITVGFCDNCEHPLWNDDVANK